MHNYLEELRLPIATVKFFLFRLPPTLDKFRVRIINDIIPSGIKTTSAVIIRQNLVLLPLGAPK